MNPGDWPTTIRFLDVTQTHAADNLALDEALAMAVDENRAPPLLRIWEPSSFAIVLGRSNTLEAEVHQHAAIEKKVAVLRRISGGGTVVIGPGCLCFSLFLPISPIQRDAGILATTHAIMAKIASSIGKIMQPIDVAGTSDLLWRGLKFSGNAQRWYRNSLLHHGTILYDFDLELVTALLATPARQPTYRQQRPHQEFITNLPLNREAIVAALRSAWNATLPFDAALPDITSLVATRYSQPSWINSP